MICRLCCSHFAVMLPQGGRGRGDPNQGAMMNPNQAQGQPGNPNQGQGQGFGGQQQQGGGGYVPQNFPQDQGEPPRGSDCLIDSSSYWIELENTSVTLSIFRSFSFGE